MDYWIAFLDVRHEGTYGHIGTFCLPSPGFDESAFTLDVDVIPYCIS